MNWESIIPAKVTREDRIKDLRKGPVIVTFTKVDGSTRVMRCTLDSTRIPGMDTTPPTPPSKPRPVNENVCVVFDLDKQEWRSFRLDSVVMWDLVIDRAHGGCGGAGFAGSTGAVVIGNP